MPVYQEIIITVEVAGDISGGFLRAAFQTDSQRSIWNLAKAGNDGDG